MRSSPVLADAKNGYKRGLELAIRAPASRPRRWTATTLLFGVVLFFTLERLSDAARVTSDSASAVLEGQALAEGNLLLHGWTLSTASFIATDLPFYGFLVAIEGLSPTVAHQAGALIYTLLVLSACFLARGRDRGPGTLTRIAIVTVLLLAPAAGAASGLLLLGPFHVGTTLFLVLTFLIAVRSPDRRSSAAAVWALLTLAVLSDALALYVVVLPLLLVCARRLVAGLPPQRQFERGLLLAGVLAIPSASAVAWILRWLGGFATAPLVAAFARPEDLPKNLQLTVEGILLIFGADFFRQPFSPAALVHVAGIVFVACVWARCFRHFRGGGKIDLLTELLLFCMTADVAAYLMSNQAVDIRTSRYLVPLLVFGAVLAGREGAEWLAVSRLRRPALAAALLYLGIVAGNLAAPSPANPDAKVGAFLEKHNLTFGLGGYWEASAVTVATGGQVRVRPVQIVDNGAHAYLWEAANTWYDSSAAGNDARFVLRDQSAPLLLDRDAIKAAFGPPAREYRVGRYEVLVWDRNLLSDLKQ